MSKKHESISNNKFCEQLRVQNITLYKLLFRIEKENNKKIKNSNKLKSKNNDEN